MSETWDYTDAPPLDDVDAPRPGVPSADATAICISIDRLTQAVNRLAEARTSPTGGPQPPGPPPGAAGPPVASGGNETQIKRGKKIYAVCMSQESPRDVKQIGEHVVGHTLAKNSQQWAEADQVAVLEAFKDWGWG